MKKQVKLYNRVGYELIKKGISDDGLATYIALMSIYNPLMEQQETSIEGINNMLTDNFTLRRDDNRIENIKDSLIELDKLQVIKILEVDKRRYLVDMSNLYFDTNIKIEKDVLNPFEYDGKIYSTETEQVNNYYSLFELTDIQNLLKENGNKKSIFRYLFLLLNLKAENKDMYFFNQTREELSYITDFDTRTIDKYNHLLMKNHIIYIYKYNYKYLDSGKTIPNAYGLYEHKEIIKDNCEKYIVEQLKENMITKSKNYANKGKNTKEYKEKLKQQKDNKKLENKSFDYDYEEVTPF